MAVLFEKTGICHYFHTLTSRFVLIMCLVGPSASSDAVNSKSSMAEGHSRLSKTKQLYDIGDVRVKNVSQVLSTMFRLTERMIRDIELSNGYTDNAANSLVASGVSSFSGVFSVQKSLNRFENFTASTKCIEDTQRLLFSWFNESWAFSFLDSSGKPGPSMTLGWVNFVGNYDQCRDSVAPPRGASAGFRGNYCVLQAEIYHSPFQPQIGACFPDTCSSTEIKSFMSHLFNASTTNITSVQCLTATTEVTTATVFAIIILSVVCGLVLLGTCWDVYFIQRPTWGQISTSDSDDSRTYQSIGRTTRPRNNVSNDEVRPVLPTYNKQVDTPDLKEPSSRTLIKLIVAFSVYTNSKKILDTSQPSGSLESLHGIRFLSMCWVILGHTYFNGRNVVLNQYTQLPIYTQRWTFDTVANAYVSVDTFFALSGLLVSYLTLKQFTKSKTWKINWPLFYFHRFWRLTPPYASILVTVLGLQQYLGQGPLWANEQPSDRKACEHNWWTNLLYINNFKTSGGFCMRVSWYLANDMQFYILSPLFLIPFYLHRIAGAVSCLAVLLASWIVSGVLSSENHWSAHERITGDLVWFEDYYIKPWNRIGPFVVGIISGYILHEAKGRSLRIKWWLVALGWIVASASALFVLYGTHGDISGDHPSTNDAAALYNAVARSVWGASVCWVIVACEIGYGRPVMALLSWSPFVVLGRLTYMMYLVHPTVIDVFFHNLGMPYYTNDTTMVVFFLGVSGLSGLAAFVFMLLFESPMIGVEKIFISNVKNK